MSEDLNTKSLGEKLFEAFGNDGWANRSTDNQAMYERTAIAFAASLSHDETASAVIADLRQRLQAAEERAGDLDRANEMLADQRDEQKARAKAAEERAGKLGELLSLARPIVGDAFVCSLMIYTEDDRDKLRARQNRMADLCHHIDAALKTEGA